MKAMIKKRNLQPFKSKIWLSSPHMSGKERTYIEKAFATNWIAPLGPNVDGFENDLRNYLGEKVYVSALSSGTAAIHLALIILNVQPGDEVICQSMTFSASANPIRYLGATPVFVDSEPDTWNISPEFLEKAIRERTRLGKKPKVIIVVHLYGMPAKMNDIISIGKKYDIPVLEDAAEALGSSVDDIKCGTFGDIGVLSFNGNKIITTSGGGALVSKNREYVETATYLASQARDPAPHYQHSRVGYNYRLSNVCAGIGRGQMEVLDKRVFTRRRNFEVYKKGLNDIPEFSFLKEPPGFFSNRWLTTMFVNCESNEELLVSIINKLSEFNVECRPLWKPLHLQPVFANSPYFGTNISETLFKSGLCLPSSSNLKTKKILKVIRMIRHHFSFK